MHACRRERLEVTDAPSWIVEESAIRANSEIVVHCEYNREVAIESSPDDTCRQRLGPGMQVNDGIRRIEQVECCAKFFRGSNIPNSPSDHTQPVLVLEDFFLAEHNDIDPA